MILKYGTLAALLSLTVALPSSANDPFAELDQEVAQLSADDTAEFEQWYVARIEEFNHWQQAYLAEWDNQQKASIEKWGDSKTPSPDVIVVYDKKYDARTVVDLEKGEVTVSYLPKAASGSKQTQVEAKIVNDVIESNSKFWEQVGVPKPKEAKPKAVVVSDVQVQQKTLEDVKREIEKQTARQMSQLDMFVDQQASLISKKKQDELMSEQKAKMTNRKQQRIAKVKQTLTRKDETLKKTPQTLVSYSVKIPKSSLSNRANKYLPAVAKEASKRQLSPELVLAIMHEESHFNPRARSYVPAFGLMQIVPTTAGHDVNKLYRGKDKPMREKELYDPLVNIETGSAYLKILQSRYLKGIKDPQSSIYSVIAAYNTGAGNVAKAFGERSVSRAVQKINAMSSEQVYQQLIKNLPYEETRKYLKKVNDRFQVYRAQSNPAI